MLLLQLNITYTCDKGYKTANLYVRVMGELKKIKKTTINERILMEVGIGMREGEVIATGFKRGSSADVTLRWKKVM